MKVLWICNMVLPYFASDFNIKPSQFGGWMTGAYDELRNTENIDLSFAFPIYDEQRRHDLKKNGNQIYAFNGMMDSEKIDDIYVDEFIRIYEEEKPDIVHIWGTEYNHSYYSLYAANKLRIANKVLVDIQGVVTFISKHFLDGIPESVIEDYKYKNHGGSLKNQQAYYEKQGEVEKKTLKLTKYVTGRTEWDYACAKRLNPELVYFSNNRVLRRVFYSNAGKWKFEDCNKHSVLISNASYALKGFHIFIQAVGLLLQKFDDLKIVVVGPNPLETIFNGVNSQYASYIAELISQMGVGEHIVFKGVVNEEDMIKELLNANVFVVSSTVENSCNALCEAMIIGTPCVSSYAGGLSSLIEDGVSGYYYQVNAPYMAAHYIERIFDDSCCAKRISENSVSTALMRHNRKDISNNLCNIYEEINNETRIIDR